MGLEPAFRENDSSQYINSFYFNAPLAEIPNKVMVAEVNAVKAQRRPSFSNKRAFYDKLGSINH